MSLLESPHAFESLDLGLDDIVIDLNDNRVDYVPRPVGRVDVRPDHVSEADDPEPELERPDVAPTDVEVSRAVPTGLYLRRVSLRSVAKLAVAFFTVGCIAAVGSALVLWATASQLGVVASFESLVTNSLGVERFEVSGGTVIGVFAVVAAVTSGLGILVTMLVAAIYNLTGSLFGGLAFETNPFDAVPHDEPVAAPAT